MADCIFCKIGNGDFNTEFLYEDNDFVAFNDIEPQAPTHILVITKNHIESVSKSKNSEEELVGKLLIVAKKVCEKLNISDYRLVINNGAGAGQEVMHIHLHILSGRDFSWPPG